MQMNPDLRAEQSWSPCTSNFVLYYILLKDRYLEVSRVKYNYVIITKQTKYKIYLKNLKFYKKYPLLCKNY